MTELKSLLRSCNVPRWFVLNLIRITAPREEKLMKDHSFQFEDLKGAELEALPALQSKRLSQPLFAIPDLTERHTMYIDACDKHIGSGPLQYQPDKPQSSMDIRPGP